MYTKKHIEIITLSLVAIIFILINIFQFKNQSNIEKLLEQGNVIQENIIKEISKEEKNNNTIIKETNSLNKNELTEQLAIVEEIYSDDFIESEDFVETEPEDWFIKIPKIDLIAPISNGTSEKILNESVGHFEESAVLNGNVCLAAHNRGYDVNYFEKIKNLLLNDIIIYQYGNNQKTYSVSNITIINEEDWSYIENSNGNQITLITCVENEPEYRLCVQAKEII